MNFKTTILCICSFFLFALSLSAQEEAIDGPEITSHHPFKIAKDYANFKNCNSNDPEQKKTCFNENFKAHFVKNFKIPKDSISQQFKGKVYFKLFTDHEGHVDHTVIYNRAESKFIEENLDQTLKKLPALKTVQKKDTLISTVYVLYAKFNPEKATQFKVIDIAINKEVVKEEDITDLSFSVIEEFPVFPGCESEPKANLKSCFKQKINKHIQRKFTCPDEIMALDIGGRVYISFAIQKNGSVGNIRTKGPHPLLELEGRRIIAQLPKMIPAKHRGKPARIDYTAPITFKIQ